VHIMITTISLVYYW